MLWWSASSLLHHTLSRSPKACRSLIIRHRDIHILSVKQPGFNAGKGAQSPGGSRERIRQRSRQTSQSNWDVQRRRTKEGLRDVGWARHSHHYEGRPRGSSRHLSLFFFFPFSTVSLSLTVSFFLFQSFFFNCFCSDSSVSQYHIFNSSLFIATATIYRSIQILNFKKISQPSSMCSSLVRFDGGQIDFDSFWLPKDSEFRCRRNNVRSWRSFGKRRKRSTMLFYRKSRKRMVTRELSDWWCEVQFSNCWGKTWFC